MHGKAPGGAALPEADLSDMDFFLDQIEVILPVLGLDVLRPITTVTTGTINPAQSVQDSAVATPGAALVSFIFDVGAAKARGVEINGEFIVKAQSVARVETAPSLPKTYRALRDQLIADGALQTKDNQTLLFTRDVPFNSPSAAASVVYGASISGPANWHVEGASQTYADLRQDSLQAAEATAENQ